MKYKKQLERLKQKQNWYDRLPENEKSSRKRPASVKKK